MKKLVLFFGLAFFALNISISQTENADFVNVEKVKIIADSMQTDTTSAPVDTTKINDTGDKKVRKKKKDSDQKADTKEEKGSYYIYILKRKNPKTGKRERLKYDPKANKKSIDEYISEGWRVVRVKDLNGPSLVDNLLRWAKTIWTIIGPMISDANESNEGKQESSK